MRYLVLKRKPQEAIHAYKRPKPHASFHAQTNFVIPETAETGLPVKYLFTDGRAAMTIFIWCALGFSFITHFYLSAWLTTLLSEYSHQMTIPFAQRTSALFQMGVISASRWPLDRYGIPAVTGVMLLPLPVAALGLLDGGTTVTMALATISGILILGSAPGLNAIAGMVHLTFHALYAQALPLQRPGSAR